MTPGPDLYYKCPKCGHITANKSLYSGNTLGAIQYSDGKLIAPMLPTFPQITKCAKCDEIFLLNKEIEVDKDSVTLKDIDYAQFLTIEDYLFLIDDIKDIPIDLEINFRREILWLFNDRIRENTAIFQNKNDVAIWETNNNRLIQILDDNNEFNKILKAELYRNLGKFQESKNIFASFKNEKHKWLIDLFNKELSKENRSVFLLNENT